MAAARLLQGMMMQLTQLTGKNKNQFHFGNANGFSLIELLIVVLILGLTSTFGIPAFNGWIADAKTRTFTEVLQNNLRIAQAEAVKSGRQVQFFLTESTPALGAATSVSGKNWGIQSMSLTDSGVAETFVEGGSMAGQNTTITIAASTSIFQFNSIGRLTAPAQGATIDVSNSNGERPLRVTVSAAGAIRMCDPSKAITDAPYGC